MYAKLRGDDVDCKAKFYICQALNQKFIGEQNIYEMTGYVVE